VTSCGRPELQRARDWSSALASALDTAAAEVGDLARRLAAGWPDAHGREWSERLQVLRHTLANDADAAVRLGQAAERATDEPIGHAAAGPRLGGIAARRADDERGVRIPRLDDDPPGG
jgi:hypothetical protein